MMRKSMLIVALILFGACLYKPAHAQSDADLRRANQRLQVENEDLRRELEAARQRVADLEQEVARLRRQLERVRTGEPIEEEPEVDEPREPGSVDETDPAASPRALLNALIACYEETLGEMEIGTSRSRERDMFIRALQQWREKMHRDYRRLLIEWHVRVVEATPTEGGYTMRLLVIDPKNLAELGSPFTLHLPRRMMRRYEQLAARGEVGLLVLRGWITPAININESRTAPGPFNNPPFIGAFAEFHFNLEPRSLMPAGEEE